MPLKTQIPLFVPDREGLLDFIYGLAGFKDIDLDNYPDFNKCFFLSGELILFLESHPYYHIDSNGEVLMFLKKEGLLILQEVKAIFYFGK